MVSFSCESCAEVVTKKKADAHANRCRDASFACLDCMTHFKGTEYRDHTTCDGQAQKQAVTIHGKGTQRDRKERSSSVKSMCAYVEDAPDVDAPPRAPSPPPCKEALPPVNVFDFLVAEQTPNASKVSLPAPVDESRMIEDRGQPSSSDHPLPSPVNEHRHREHQPQEFAHPEPYDPHSHYAYDGFAYGAEPLPCTVNRYESFATLADPYDHPPPAYQTPAPRDVRHLRTRSSDYEMDDSNKKMEKKRKRQQLEELDLSLVRGDHIMTDAPPPLHSGLTGGLNRLLSRPDPLPSPDYSGNDLIDPSPLSPTKRYRRDYPGRARNHPRDFDKLQEQDRGRDRGRVTSGTSSSTMPTDNDRSRRVRRDTQGARHRERDTDRDRRREEGPRRSDRRRRRRRSSSSDSIDRADKPRSRLIKTIEYKRVPSNDGDGQLVLHKSNSNGPTSSSASTNSTAELFTSFITKGPDSERGCSVNKVLKRYHRERHARDADLTKADFEKDLWKSLRLRRNDRGEVVLFF